MKKVEGLAHSFVSELQNFKHFMQEEESKLEDKLYEWRDNALHYPEELQKKINEIKHLIQNYTANN